VPRKTGDPWWDAAQGAVYAQQPRFFTALVADAKINAAARGERAEFRGRLDALLQAVRLMWVTDAFFALALYRAKARLQVLGVPMLPRLFHHLAIAAAQLCIGETVLVHPGILIGHGFVVIDGFVEIGRGVTILPGVTIGLRQGKPKGPTIGENAFIGTGAKVLGGINVGRGARIGANSVVISDVPPGATVVGAPARIVSAH
jgi:serine O-acetyltransferase